MADEIIVHGLKELRSAFRQVGAGEGWRNGSQRLTQAYRVVSEKAAADAQSGARSGSRLQAKMAGGIKPRATVNRGAGISINNTKAFPAAKAAFWGITRRTGWFADGKYSGYTGADQGFPPWVGNTWLAAVPGQGPHQINDALAAHLPEYAVLLEESIYKALADTGLL